MLEQLGLEGRITEEPLPEHTLPGLIDEGILLYLDRNLIGFVGLASSRLLKSTDGEGPVWVSELDWDACVKKAASVQKKYQEPPKFPASQRDLALLVPKGTAYRTLVQACRSTKEKTLTDVHLFDLYTGKNLPEGTTSYGLRLTFQDRNGTLKDGAIDAAIQKIVTQLQEVGAQLRG